jgi:2-oxo-3-hexenedioate decarboxylase/2-keto-4-pentenoate hydratase
MGIAHPCGGRSLSITIHGSPARVAKADFVNLRIESEIALKLAADMPAGQAPWTAQSAAPFVAAPWPAYELIEDRHAVYVGRRRPR